MNARGAARVAIFEYQRQVAVSSLLAALVEFKDEVPFIALLTEADREWLLPLALGAPGYGERP